MRILTIHGAKGLEAPLVLTFCADTHRTRQWLAQRDARLGFADFISWHVAGYDAIILAQTTALALVRDGRLVALDEQALVAACLEVVAGELGSEAVEQLRGAAVNQVPDAKLALVTGGPSVIPVSGLILAN